MNKRGAAGSVVGDDGGRPAGGVGHCLESQALDPQGLPFIVLHLQTHPECVHRPFCPPAGPALSAWVSPMGVPTLGPSHAPRHCILSLRDGKAPRGAAGNACAERHLPPTPTPRGSPAAVPTGSEVTHLGPAAHPLSDVGAVICGELSGGPRLGQAWARTSCGHFDDVGGVDPVISTVVGKQ